jgi:hypothetical protein
MTTVRFSLLILFACVSTSPLVAQMPSPSATYFSAQVLKSPYFEFSYRVPDNLVPNTSEVEHQLLKQGSVPLTSTSFVLFAAYEPPSRMKRRRGVTVAAHNAGTHTAKIYSDKLESFLREEASKTSPLESSRASFESERH